MDNTCFNCGCKFHPTRSDQLFCNKSCRYKYHHSGPLTLTLKRKWFDMILLGIKTVEYREIKEYWTKRFERYFGRYYDFSVPEPEKPRLIWNSQPKEICFRNGYHKDSPSFVAECTIREGTGNPEWGAVPDTVYYILEIRDIRERKGC